MDSILNMVINKDIKLELDFNFYMRSSIRIHITKLSNIFKYVGINQKLLTLPDGFIIDSGYVFSYNRHNMTIPTYVTYEDDLDNSDLFTYFNFLSDNDRYESMKRLYKYMQQLSQSKIFHYDNAGYVDMIDNKWILY